MPRPHILCSFSVNAIQSFNNYLQNNISKQLKVNRELSYHVIKNNLQVKIKDKEKKIIIKSMDYDALIYHEIFMIH